MSVFELLGCIGFVMSLWALWMFFVCVAFVSKNSRKVRHTVAEFVAKRGIDMYEYFWSEGDGSFLITIVYTDKTFIGTFVLCGQLSDVADYTIIRHDKSWFDM